MTLTTEKYTEGLCGDGAAILCDGVPMSISEILAALNAAARQEAQPVGYIDPDSLKEYRGQRAGGTWSAVQRTTSGLNMTTPIYTAPPAVPPEGSCD
ncbi:hypothetical protein I5Q42_06110 [Serratia marcescens]|nr:hypothetical protein [Serratia marcescens]MBH2910571.1 hypothetical protein [Serratia marcescens]HCU0428871.1 hypothetical protein [Serratia marcescens]